MMWEYILGVVERAVYEGVSRLRDEGVLGVWGECRVTNDAFKTTARQLD